MKRIQNVSVNLTGYRGDKNGPLNLPEMVPVIGMDGMTRLCYTRLHDVIYTVMPRCRGKIMSFPVQIHTRMS